MGKEVLVVEPRVRDVSRTVRLPEIACKGITKVGISMLVLIGRVIQGPNVVNDPESEDTLADQEIIS